MMSAVRRRQAPLLRISLLALPLAFALAACETMQDLNPFAERQTPLPGERQPLFPEGVPGVDFRAPPPQPMNSNIPIPSQSGSDDSSLAEQIENQQGDGEAAQTQAARAQRPASDGTADDAWTGAR